MPGTVPASSFLMGGSGWKCGGGPGGQRVRDAAPPLPSLGCCHDNGSDRHVPPVPPPSSFSLTPLPELRGSVWVGSLLGGLPRLQGSLGHSQGLRGPGRPQTTLSRAFFSSDAFDDSDDEEEPVTIRESLMITWKRCRSLLFTDCSYVTQHLPGLCPKRLVDAVGS